MMPRHVSAIAFLVVLFTCCVRTGAAETNAALPAVSQLPHAPENSRMERVSSLQNPRPGLPPVDRTLTPEQRKQLRDAIEAHRPEITKLNEQLRLARQAATLSQLADKFDEADFLAKTAVAAQLESQLALINARAFNALRPNLTAEQLQQLRNLTRPPVTAAPATNPPAR